MRFLKWLLGVVVVLGSVFVGGAYLLPREVSVARSVTINASPQEVFGHVNSMKATEAWSPWMRRDPDMATVYSGPETGVGARLEWSSDNPDLGSGSQEIIASVPDNSVETALDFGAMGQAKAQFLLAPKDGTTQVTWTLVTDTGSNPMMRWMGLMMDSFVGPDYQEGLSNLKTLVEGR